MLSARRAKVDSQWCVQMDLHHKWCIRHNSYAIAELSRSTAGIEITIRDSATLYEEQRC